MRAVCGFVVADWLCFPRPLSVLAVFVSLSVHWAFHLLPERVKAALQVCDALPRITSGASKIWYARQIADGPWYGLVLVWRLQNEVVLAQDHGGICQQQHDQQSHPEH